jgi:hypothetical protein
MDCLAFVKVANLKGERGTGAVVSFRVGAGETGNAKKKGLPTPIQWNATLFATLQFVFVGISVG